MLGEIFFDMLKYSYWKCPFILRSIFCLFREAGFFPVRICLMNLFRVVFIRISVEVYHEQRLSAESTLTFYSD